MRCSIVFILLAITFGRSLSQHCEVDESQHECGGYCYGAVKPVLEYLAILQKRVESCEAKQPADTLSKIALINEKLETLAGIQQYLEKRSTAKTHELEQQVAAVRQELDTKSTGAQELGNSSQILKQKVAAVRQEMDEKIETLGKQIAIHQELEKKSGEKILKLEQQLASERKERDETLQAMETSLKEKVKTLEQKLTAVRNEILKPKPKNVELFKKIGSKYYYKENTKDRSWEGAWNKCQEMGAHLVSLQNEDELKALDSMLHPNGLYWIDLKKLEAKGEFISATTGVKGTFFHWGKREPYGKNWDCVFLYRGEMRTRQCDLTEYFICEAYWVD